MMHSTSFSEHMCNTHQSIYS